MASNSMPLLLYYHLCRIEWLVNCGAAPSHMHDEYAQLLLEGIQQRLFADAFAKAGAQAHEGWRVVMLELARHAGMK